MQQVLSGRRAAAQFKIRSDASPAIRARMSLSR
jgi:hypothetical protein